MLPTPFFFFGARDALRPTMPRDAFEPRRWFGGEGDLDKLVPRRVGDLDREVGRRVVTRRVVRLAGRGLVW